MALFLSVVFEFYQEKVFQIIFCMHFLAAAAAVVLMIDLVGCLPLMAGVTVLEYYCRHDHHQHLVPTAAGQGYLHFGCCHVVLPGGEHRVPRGLHGGYNRRSCRTNSCVCAGRVVCQCQMDG